MSPTASRTCPASRPPAREAWRCALASVLALALVAIGLAAHSPQAHEHVHHDDAHDADHACAITLAAAGYCDTSAPAPLVTHTTAAGTLSPPPSGSFAWTTPDYWLIPAQAPPARAS